MRSTIYAGRGELAYRYYVFLFDERDEYLQFIKALFDFCINNTTEWEEVGNFARVILPPQEYDASEVDAFYKSLYIGDD